jgi:hypothetical protein
MRISEMRHQLDRLRKKHGDLEVVMDSNAIIEEEPLQVRTFTPLDDLCLPLEGDAKPAYLMLEG